MLSTLPILVPWLASRSLVATVVLAPGVGVRLAEGPRTTSALLVMATVGVVALTPHPAGATSPAIACDAGLPHLAPTALGSTADDPLSVPVAFLAGLLRRLAAVVRAVALSVAIETVRAVALVLGRARDTHDGITNTIGAVLAAAALAWRRRRATDAGQGEAARVRATGAKAISASTDPPRRGRPAARSRRPSPGGELGCRSAAVSLGSRCRRSGARRGMMLP